LRFELDAGLIGGERPDGAFLFGVARHRTRHPMCRSNVCSNDRKQGQSFPQADAMSSRFVPSAAGSCKAMPFASCSPPGFLTAGGCSFFSVPSDCKTFGDKSFSQICDTLPCGHTSFIACLIKDKTQKITAGNVTK